MVLEGVAALSAAGSVAAALRWWVRGADDLGRPRAFPAITVAVTLVVAVVSAVPVVRHARAQDRLEAVARVLVGQPAQVHCQTFGETWTDAGGELGYVRWGPGGVPERRTLIKYEPCRDLAAYRRGVPSRADDLPLAQVVAVHVLTHESMHMRGLTSESQAECAAVQRDALTATLLGADPAQARALARRYWREVYPRMPSEYVTGACAPGGAQDEHLADPPWS